VFNFILFNNIKYYIVENNIHINYYCNSCYISQLSEFNDCKNINIIPIQNKPSNSTQLWIESPQLSYRFTPVREFYFKSKNMPLGRIYYNIFYLSFFNIFLNVNLKLRIKLKHFYYKDFKLLKRCEKLIDKYEDKYKNIDILVLNSQPLSGQYEYNKIEWDNYIRNVSEKFKVVTTTKINDIVCTMDDNLTIRDIAALSTKVKVVIAINSGVVPGLLNKHTLLNVKQFYTFDDRCMYSYPNFQPKNNINDITIEELNKYIKR
jgi:hypothetical protein